jgi:hypothetical protein
MVVVNRMVVLLVDALGWELASRRPGFAPGLVHRRRLETVLGFSTGALPTLFTGRLPREHGRFLMYRRADGPGVFHGFGAIGWLPPRIQRSWRFGRWLRRVVEARGVRGYYDLYEVPRPLLSEFDLVERDDPFAPGGLPVDSLWDALERRGIAWRGWNWRTPESQALAEVAERIEHGDERFLFCYTADFDAILHREGSHGPHVAPRLERYSSWLSTLTDAAARRGERLGLYLLSDHGMVDVDRHADVMSAVARLGLRMPADFLAFYDSSMARFWWRSPSARSRVHSALANFPGRWLDGAALAAVGCEFADHAYGDEVFLLDPGALLVPSFMGGDPVAAMHGYDPSHPDMAALLWSNRPVPPQVRALPDVRGFLESELDALAREAA